MTGRGAFILPLLLAGCASQSLTLLPDESGGSGAVAVLESGGRNQETIVDRANSRTRLGSARPSTRGFDPAKLSKDDRRLVEDLPPPAARFTLYFREGGTDLVPSSTDQLRALFEQVAARPGAEVQVTGHTDTLGQAEDNDRLSLERAREIRDLLIAQGLDAGIASAVGRGERELREQTADGVRNAANRRVEVIVR
jgi:outer membrane protein OmpA-like peptidoglycan-associated protein